MSLNTVNVIAIDEERLKFRVTVSFFAPALAQNQGEYKFLLPAPTSFANSHEYNSCIITCGGFQAYTLLINDPCWTNSVALDKIGTIDLQLDIPSSQTSTTTNLVAADDRVGNTRLGGYRELLMLDIKSVGDNNGTVVLQGSTAAWNGKSENQPILCGNPFGQTLTIRNNNPITDSLVWLVANAAGGGAGGADLGCYIYSFDITMVPNNP
tara:strand:+ start:49 stop:678 length:630 start_codon:yes stop_codon:yes gene_type:complete